DLRFLQWGVAALGIGLVLFIVATLGRGVRERVRREVLLPDRALARAEDPAAHRRAAEAALAGGRAREAIHELYLSVLRSLAASALTADTSGGVSRSASVYDTGPGGTAALRNYLEAMGASTTTVQGDTFAADPSQVGVLFMLGPSETFTQFDVDAVRRFVTAGGTAVLAT